MRKAVRLLPIALVGLIAAPAVAQEPVEGREPTISSTVAVDFLSHYVWRGVRLSDGFVMQPSVGVESHGFGVNLWWNLAGGGCDCGESSDVLTETNLTVSYSHALGGPALLSAGMIYYGNRGAPDTTELYAGISGETLLNPSFTFYYDVDEGDGALALLSIGHEVELPADVTLALSAAASYNMKHKVMGMGPDDEPYAGFYHGELGLSVSLPLARRLTLAPRITYTFPLTDKARYAMEGASYDGKTSSLVSGGIGLIVEF